MTDLHTHILPGMDDGATDIKTSLQMLEMEAKQGVKAVALTPHFYRSREHISDFLKRREDSMQHLYDVLDDTKHPRLILGAEVAYVNGIADWDELEQLCYEETRILLVEPPMTPWNDEMFRQLYALEGRRGITPMIAHFERYLATQKKAHIKQMLDTGFPVQVSAASLLRFRERKRALELLTNYNAILISDCHNTTTRPPNLDAAVRVLEKKLGSCTQEILRNAELYHQWGIGG